jgi:hypothetical protein
MFKNVKNHINKVDDVSVIKLWNRIHMKGKGPLNYAKFESEPRQKKGHPGGSFYHMLMEEWIIVRSPKKE